MRPRGSRAPRDPIDSDGIYYASITNYLCGILTAYMQGHTELGGVFLLDSSCMVKRDLLGRTRGWCPPD